MYKNKFDTKTWNHACLIWDINACIPLEKASDQDQAKVLSTLGRIYRSVGMLDSNKIVMYINADLGKIVMREGFKFNDDYEHCIVCDASIDPSKQHSNICNNCVAGVDFSIDFDMSNQE